MLEHERIRTLEAQIDQKNKNIEARQNVTGSDKKRVYYRRTVPYIKNMNVSFESFFTISQVGWF